MTVLPFLPDEPRQMTPYVCPPHLTTDSRVEFRTRALEALDAAIADGASAVVLDLAAVVDIDASGLGVLILLQKRARERALRVRLLNVPRPVEQLLAETRMGPLFDLQHGT